MNRTAPEERDIRQDREDDLRQLDAGLPEIGFADHAGHAKPEDGQGQSGRHLIGNERQGQEAEQQRKQRSGSDAGENADIGRSGHLRGDEGADGAHDHHAFDAEIENTGTLGDEFTDGRKHKRRRRGNDRQQDGFKDTHQRAPSPVVSVKSYHIIRIL